MKLILDADYVKAQEEMEGEKEERTMELNPTSSTPTAFKNFTCAFMFSTMKHFKLMEEIKDKLDQAIEGNRARDEQITKLTEDVNDLKTGVAHRDAEIQDLQDENKRLNELIVSNKKETDQKLSDLMLNVSRKITVASQAASKASLDNERHSRSFNLRAFNIKEEANEKAEQTIRLIDATIKRITGQDIQIEYGHRTGKKKSDGSPRGVIFRFASRQDRWKVFSKRKEFFAAEVPLYEDLPASDLVEKKKHAEKIKELYRQDCKVAFIRGQWFVDGNVFNG